MIIIIGRISLQVRLSPSGVPLPLSILCLAQLSEAQKVLIVFHNVLDTDGSNLQSAVLSAPATGDALVYRQREET
jgi:hypothetical protein